MKKLLFLSAILIFAVAASQKQDNKEKDIDRRIKEFREDLAKAKTDAERVRTISDLVKGELHPKILFELSRFLTQGTPLIRVEAIKGVTLFKNDENAGRALYQAFLARENQDIKYKDVFLALIDSLGQLRYKASVRELNQMILYEDSDVAFHAIKALGKIRDKSSIEPLLTLFKIITDKEKMLKALDDLLNLQNCTQLTNLFDAINRSKNDPKKLEALRIELQKNEILKLLKTIGIEKEFIDRLGNPRAPLPQGDSPFGKLLRREVTDPNDLGKRIKEPYTRKVTLKSATIEALQSITRMTDLKEFEKYLKWWNENRSTFKVPIGDRYINKKWGYSIEIPDDWSKQELENTFIVGRPIEPGANRPASNFTIMIGVEEVSKDMNLNKYCETKLAESKKHGIQPAGPARIEIAKTTALKVIYKEESEKDWKMQGIFFFLIKGARAYTISFRETQGDFPKYKTIFEEIAQTFRFE